MERLRYAFSKKLYFFRSLFKKDILEFKLKDYGIVYATWVDFSQT